MSKPVICVALSQFCEHDDQPRHVLVDAGYEVRENRAGRRLKRDELVSALSGAGAVLAGVEPYDADILNSLPDLRCISRCGVGTDAIDLDAARRLGIEVLTTDDEVVEPVAQMTVAMILALARNFPMHLADFRSRQWKKHTGFLLSEWTIGLIGFGRIGRRVESLLNPFSPRTFVTDPALSPSDVPDGAKICPLDRLLAEADLVSIHAGRRRGEGALIGPDELSMMRQGSRLVNTSRGYLVDERALLEALKAGRLAGVALDVFEDEPYDGPFMELPQVLCTPHVSTLTTASRAAMELRCSENVISFFRRSSSV